MNKSKLIGLFVVVLLVSSLAYADTYDDIRKRLENAKKSVLGQPVDTTTPPDTLEPTPPVTVEPSPTIDSSSVVPGDIEKTQREFQARRNELDRLASQVYRDADQKTGGFLGTGIGGDSIVKSFDQAIKRMFEETNKMISDGNSRDDTTREAYAKIARDNMNSVQGATARWTSGDWAKKYEDVNSKVNDAIGKGSWFLASDGFLTNYIEDSDYSKPIPSLGYPSILWDGQAPVEGQIEEKEIEKRKEGGRGPIEKVAGWVGLEDEYRGVKNSFWWVGLVIALVLMGSGYAMMRHGPNVSRLWGVGFFAAGVLIGVWVGIINFWTILLAILIFLYRIWPRFRRTVNNGITQLWNTITRRGGHGGGGGGADPLTVAVVHPPDLPRGGTYPVRLTGTGFEASTVVEVLAAHRADLVVSNIHINTTNELTFDLEVLMGALPGPKNLQVRRDRTTFPFNIEIT